MCVGGAWVDGPCLWIQTHGAPLFATDGGKPASKQQVLVETSFKAVLKLVAPQAGHMALSTVIRSNGVRPPGAGHPAGPVAPGPGLGICGQIPIRVGPGVLNHC